MYSSSANPPFDVLTTTANDLRLLLEEGSITSRKIVETYLNHIEKHNVSGAKCRAVVSSPPTFLLMDHATRLDKERAEGKIRGPLHGIPILIKVHELHRYSFFMSAKALQRIPLLPGPHLRCRPLSAHTRCKTYSHPIMPI